jgi:predicted nucleic acid-binding protein
MNKRAKKRLKEAIEKDNVERAKTRTEQNHPSAKGLQERKGFTAKPSKKRG